MKKHPFLLILLVLVVVGLVLGISAGDLWSYIIDFLKEGISLFIAWMDQIITAIRDSLNTAAGIS